MKVIFFICLYELRCKGTKKNADEQENPFFLVYMQKFLYLCALFYDDMIIVA